MAGANRTKPYPLRSANCQALAHAALCLAIAPEDVTAVATEAAVLTCAGCAVQNGPAASCCDYFSLICLPAVAAANGTAFECPAPLLGMINGRRRVFVVYTYLY
jgi:hypothetical protein